MGTLTVMTLNIWNVRQWEHRRDAVVQWVNEVAPDVLALQEAVRMDGFCQASWIAEQTGMAAVFGAAGSYSGAEFGNAVLSRFPVTRSHCRSLEQASTRDVPRAILTVEVQAYGRAVSVSSTHLSYRFDEGWVRERQVQDIADVVEQFSSSDFPTIVCGDFNAVAAATEVRFLKGLHALDGRSCHLWDAFEVMHPHESGFTWSNVNPYAAEDQNPDRRIDYIFAGARTGGGAGRIIEARLVCDQPRHGVWPSDHFGVAAVLSCPARS
ncbi:endonuclease/exonuclease/phosphatase family metal-dependent hydrolase [Mycobacterium sp. OAS707]|uniref:endonuclease/exonuclease/phosphatase family protein n=1 Tax=Mycobacterium sp. OAS707 TaxID=2663822 RepID=UPI00178981A3|nr:endonuclease/exonuclease/phosphatase family protein [Mycobacterium sp. OAS707]MBE1552163.1 endonuclease/exonuclease/phosphatase family metal-dependent hydrolase [Mycobacterium sp. OAS707]